MSIITIFASMENLVEIKDVTIYRKTNKVVSGLNLSVRQGEFLYLTGKVGSGKSSILKILYADEGFKGGSVIVAGYDLASIKEADIPFLRRKLGIVFQDYKLLTDRNVYDNLRFVLEASGVKSKTEIKKQIYDTLEIVGLEGKEERMPFELSGGEQQSVGIARALINDPLLILADEPTGNLDDISSDNIMYLLHNIVSSGTSVLMATHDTALLKKFPAKIFNVEENQFVEY